MGNAYFDSKATAGLCQALIALIAPHLVYLETLCADGAMSAESRVCGRGLGDIAPDGHERRVLVDILFETRELTVEAEITTCPRCRTESRGSFPDDMPGPLQYGHGILAFATHLMAAHMVPLKRAAQTLKVLTGRAVAEATLLA